MSKLSKDKPLSLITIASKLRDDDLDAALAAYREPAVAGLRVYAVLIAAAWAVLWYLLGPSDIPRTPRFWNYPQAVAVLPYVLTMLPLAFTWWVMVKRQWIRPALWADAFGAGVNMIGVTILLCRSFDLMIAFICYLPMISISVGARFSRIVFFGSLILSVIIVQIAAPEPNYWGVRPHFALFALTLLVLMPLSVVRLLNTIRAVSDVALKSRDAQSRFVATMSHEFRTPLNSIINNAVLIDVDQMPESQKRIVSALTSAAAALRHRVNEVLDVRAIEAGSLTVIAEPFRISALLKTIRELAEPMAVAKNIRFEIKTSEIDEVVLKTDPARLEQVITNLTTNALKFTPENGSVELGVSRDGPESEGRFPVRFTIADTGPGIPENELENIWLPFHQISSGSARRHDGVGLGLFLVKSILSYLCGRAEYAAREGGGSIFTVHLVLERAADGESPAPYLSFREAAAEHRRQTRSMRCLVIDDAPSNLETIDRLLSIAGHSMDGARSGREGIEKARQQSYDLILLDLHMPDLTGYDVLRALQPQAARPHNPPIYMLSADASPDAIRETQALGASGYLTKPISYIKLLALLETVADGSAPLTNAHQAEPALTGLDFIEQAAGTVAAREFARICLGEIETEHRKLIEAIELRRFGDAAGIAHSLKNALLNVGASDGAKRCEDLRGELARWQGGAASDSLAGLASVVEGTRRRLVEYMR